MWKFWKRDEATAPSGDEGIRIIPNVTQSDFFEKVQSGEETHYGGKDSLTAISELDRHRDINTAIRQGHIRAAITDTESVDCLLAKYGKELDTADSLMRKKKDSEGLVELYDYNEDRRFQQWKKDRESVNERLQVHWLDYLIDHTGELMVYFLRVGTLAGFLYGAGRSVYLYRTMDKMYAKLNGVTAGRIAFKEITTGVAKGGVCAAAASGGVMAGNAFSRIISVALSGDVVVPDRKWWHVTSSVAVGGLTAGAAFSGMHYTTLSVKGMVGITGLSTAAAGLAGWYLGYYVYRPFAATREHKLYDRHWVPWQDRSMSILAPSNMRGRYK